MDSIIKPSLGGSTFVWNGIKQDYNFIETLNCLYDLCDQVSIVAGGDDGTLEAVIAWVDSKVDSKEHHKIIWLFGITEDEWKSQVGREKLSYFSNIAIANLTTDWNFYLQCDEILHEDCFETVRNAINEAHAHPINAIFARRLNLWRDPLMMLNVPQERKPVSTEVIRIARTEFRCVDDAEQIGVPDVVTYGDIDAIQIFHMGFVRDKVKHLEKIKNMQVNVFLWGDYDVKAKDCDEFKPERWFSDEDLIPIPRTLPKYIIKWCQERYPDLNIPG